jgi:mono/diheme cytochrome c family protein
MKLFRFLAYCFAFFLGAVFAFRGGNSFPAPPPKQYTPGYAVKKVKTIDNIKAPELDPVAQQGKILFLTNCAACHNRNMVDGLTGPALGGVESRWSEFPREDLYNWIRNAPGMVEAEHPRAVAIWKEWNQQQMTSFPTLSDEDIAAILTYVNAVYQS